MYNNNITYQLFHDGSKWKVGQLELVINNDHVFQIRPSLDNVHLWIAKNFFLNGRSFIFANIECHAISVSQFETEMLWILLNRLRWQRWI